MSPAGRPENPGWKALRDRYFEFCYILYGKRLDAQASRALMALKLKQADAAMTPGLYISVVTISGLLATGAAGAAFTALFAILGPADWWLYALVLTGIAAGVSFGFYPLTLTMRASTKRTEVEAELPFTLSELSILASTGIPPIEIMRRMSSRDINPHMRNEFRKVIYKVDIDGKDLVTALGETARETPSQHLRETLWDFSNMIHSGGNVAAYLRNKADDALKLKRALQKEYIDKLTGYAEMYVSLVLVAVLMVGVMAFLMDAMGTDAGGLNAAALLTLMAYGIVPLSTFVTIFLVSMSQEKAGD
jgi:flagellar protein FlaJ